MLPTQLLEQILCSFSAQLCLDDAKPQHLCEFVQIDHKVCLLLLFFVVCRCLIYQFLVFYSLPFLNLLMLLLLLVLALFLLLPMVNPFNFINFITNRQKLMLNYLIQQHSTLRMHILANYPLYLRYSLLDQQHVLVELDGQKR